MKRTQATNLLLLAILPASGQSLAGDACTPGYIFADRMESEAISATYEGMVTFLCGGASAVPPAPFAITVHQDAGNYFGTGTAQARGAAVGINLVRYCSATLRADGSIDPNGATPAVRDWRGRHVNYSYNGVASRLTESGGIATVSEQRFDGYGYNGMYVDASGIASGCSANVGPGHRLALARAEPVATNFIVAVDGEDCGVPGTKALYYRNLHPTHRLSFHVEHHWVYQAVEHRKYQRYEAAPNGNAGPAVTALDVRMGCPIPGPTMQQFHWDVTHAFRLL